MASRFLPALLLGTTLLSGCAWFDGSDIPEWGTRLQKQEAVALAKTKAETEGYDLRALKVSHVELDKTKKTYVWKVSFRPKHRASKDIVINIWDAAAENGSR